LNTISNEIKFLLKHSSIYGFGNILSKAVAFILLPLYTRYLTPTDYGIMELISITTGMIGIVVGIGISGAISRFYYESELEKERNTVISTVYIIAFIVSGISILLLSQTTEFFAGLILDSKSYSNLFLLSFISLGVGIIIDIGQIYLRILYKSSLFIAISILSLIIGVSLNIFFIVYMKYGVLGIFYSTLITNLVIGIPLTSVIIYKVGLGFRWALAKDMLKFSAPLIPSSLAITMVNYSDRYFIKHFVSIANAGIYGLAQKIGTSIHILFTSPFIMTFLPRRFEIVNKPNAKETFKKIFDYYFLAILSIGFALSVFANELMVLMTTPAFYKAGTLIPLIVLTVIILGMKYHFEFGILYSKKTKYYAYINMTTAALHLLLNLIMVSSHGIWGAIYASVIAISVNTMLIYFIGNKLYKIDFDFARNAKIFAMAAGLYFLSQYPFSTNILINSVYKFIILLSFPFFLIWMKILSYAEIYKVKEISSGILQKVRG